MKTWFYLSLLCCCIPSISLFSQSHYSSTMRWGEVPSADLQMTVYDQDSTAIAVVLGDEGVMNVQRGPNGFESVLMRHRRIKILDESAIQRYGNISLYYYHADRFDDIKGVKAQTVQADGTIEEVDRKAIYVDKVDDYYTKVTFSFPNVRPGSVLEYRYQLISGRVYAPPTWTFLEEIPVRYSAYRFKSLVPISYTYLIDGSEYLDRTEQSDGTDEYTLDKTKLVVNDNRVWLENGVALKEEPYMTTLKDYQIKIRYQASESAYSGSITSTWEEACEELMRHQKFGQRYTRKRLAADFIEASAAVVDEEAPPSEQIVQISKFLGQEVNWNGYYGIYADIPFKEVYENHEGTTAEIQLIGISLLRHYGIEAYPVLLSTRKHGRMITNYPLIDQFNYLVVLVVIDEEMLLLDFIDPLLKPGLIHESALNHKGFLVREKTPVWIDINSPVFRDVLAFQTELDENGTLRGKAQFKFRGYSAYDRRKTLLSESLANVTASLLPEGTVLDELTVEEEDKVTEPLIIKHQFELSNSAVINGSYMYINPLLSSAFAENPLKAEERYFPIDIPYPSEEQVVHIMAIPERYEVESVPDELKIASADQGISFHFVAHVNAGKIQIMQTVRVQKTNYTPSEYPDFKHFLDQIAEKLGEQIVLKKIN